MIKMVLQDFYSTRKQAFRDAWNHAGISLMGLAYLIMVASNLLGNEELTWFVASAGVDVLVAWIMILLHAMYPNRLSKPMFLVPIDKKQKKEYLKTAYMVKICMISAVYLVIRFAILNFWHTEIVHGILSAVSLSLWSMVLGLENFHGQFAVWTEDNNLGEHKAEACARWISIFVYIVVLHLVELMETNIQLIAGGGSVVFQAIICIYIVKKEYVSQMEQALGWEKYYKGEKEEKVKWLKL